MRKIAIGNSVYVNINDCTIEIDRIEINSAISTSFNFNIVRDGTTIKTVSFPLSNQTLNAGDYLNAFGINRVGSDVTEEYTAAQAAAFQSMTNLNISKGGFTVSLSNTNAILKLYYYSNREIDEQIYVLNKHEELIAVFNKNDEDPIFNPRIRDGQNAESVLTFSISPKNPKWEQIKNPENLYVTEGKMFSTNFEGCFEEFISDSNEDYISITAYERQKLLSRRYVKAWNSETGFDAIDTFMVVVLSGGELELKNGDATVNSRHPKGSSGYALDALLYGTGWTTGTCDVEGTFDLETDQIDIYENILKVQQIWGGILVFDSLNKIVHHRDETKWLPYNGYEVRYQKNMQSLEKLYNNKIVTKLCPLGESGLNIKSVNNGSEWLTNYTYTDTVLQGIENNPDITDPEQLMRWGERKLKDLCKPRKELTVQAILLYQVEGYELEEIALNHVVDVINFGGSENDIEQLRVVGYEHGVWDYSDAVLELSDITLESTDIFKKTVSVTNSINDGTLDSRKVVNFYKNGESISESFKRVDRTLIETKSELLKSDEEITARVTEVRTDVNDLSNQIVGQEKTIAEHTVSIGKIEDRIYNVEEVSNAAVKQVQVYYALGDSPTVAPTDNWDTEAPPWENGKYMWQKTVTTYVSGTIVESEPTNITGAKGETGAAGKEGTSGNSSYSYIAYANSEDGSVDFSRTDSVNKTYIGTLKINESVNENLLKKTNQGKTGWGYALQNGTRTIEDYEEDGIKGVKLTCTVASTGWQYGSFYIDTPTLSRLKSATNYIISFDIKSNIGERSIGVALKRGDSTNTIANEVKANIKGNETWEHFSVKLKTIADLSTITIGNQVVYITGMSKVGYYAIRNIKLEEGEQESAYSKSPEDLANDYTQYNWQYIKGEQGIGVSDVIDQYYLSDSDTTQTGGEWKETQDSWEEGKYIWTRTKVTWTDGSITYTNPILANNLNELNSETKTIKKTLVEQVATTEGLVTTVSETTEKLNTQYLTTDEVNKKINDATSPYEELEKRVTTVETTASGVATKVTTIENNGVNKVTTTTGYTLDDVGLTISKTGKEMSTQITEDGMTIYRDKDKTTEEEVLIADSSGVYAYDLHARTFLIVGESSRFEDYLKNNKKRTGCFWIGETEV